MARTTTWPSLFLLCLAMSVCAGAQVPTGQNTTSEGPTSPRSQGARIQNFNEVKEPNPPDMVCFGYGPKWSVQLTDGAARYLGVNQPDQDFLGTFYWDSEMKVWNWHREDGLAPMNNGFALSGTIQKAACHDSVRGETYPYSAQINLPQGDMVTGCCRRLRPGEAVIGKHGLQQTTANPAPATTNAASQQTASPQTNPPAPGTGKSKAGIPSTPR